MWVVFMQFLQQILCVVPMHVNATFNCSSLKNGVLFQNILAFSTPCCNIFRSLIESE